MDKHPASTMVHQHVATATARIQQQAAAAPPPQTPLQPRQPTPTETYKSLLLLAATALAAGAAAGALSYIVITKTRPARQRRRKSPSGSVRRQSGVSEDPGGAEQGTRRASQSGAELPPQSGAQHQRDSGAPAGRAARLRRHEQASSSSSLAEAGKLVSAGSAGRRLHATSGSASVSSPFQAQSTAASAAHAAGMDSSATTGSPSQQRPPGAIDGAPRDRPAAGSTAAAPERSGHRSHSGSSHTPSLRSSASPPVPPSSGRNMPQQPEGESPGDAERLQRSKSWAEVAAAFPVDSDAVRIEDIEVCTREDGSLWRLGAGSFGTVYKAMKNGVQPVAVKVINYDATDKQRADFDKEVAILESCRDRNLVQFLGSCSNGEQTLLITEYMEGGDLANALRSDREEGRLLYYRKKVGPDGKRVPGLGKRIALDIARGLAFLHTHRIVHLDIKSPNVLLGSDFTAKIADVGLAKLQNKDYLSAQEAIGTFTWSAPEILMGLRCSEKCDLFSFGVVLWELVTGESPARGRLRSIRVPEEAPQAVADLVAQCMHADPAARPSAKEVVSLLSQPDAVLARHLPGRRPTLPEQQGDGVRSNAAAIQEITRQLAELVYGGRRGVQEHGWAPADADTISQRVDIGLWTDAVADVGRCLRDRDIENPKSAAHTRCVQLVAFLERVFVLKMRDNPLWCFQLRNTKSTTPAQAVGGKFGDAHAVDQHAVLEAVGLTEFQKQKILERYTDAMEQMQRIAAERGTLVESLQRFDTAEDDFGVGTNFDDAVSISTRLKENMDAEGRASNECFLDVLAMLSPLQQARMAVASAPFVWDPCALAELLHAQQLRADSGDLRPGSRSLMEQAMSASSEGGMSRNNSLDLRAGSFGAAASPRSDAGSAFAPPAAGKADRIGSRRRLERSSSQ